MFSVPSSLSLSEALLSSVWFVDELASVPAWVFAVPLVPPVGVVPVLGVPLGLPVLDPVAEVVVGVLVVVPWLAVVLLLAFACAGELCIRYGATKTPIEATIRAATASQRL